MNKIVLITGGAGYVGCILTKTLLQHNFKVVVVDCLWFNQITPSIWMHDPNYTFINVVNKQNLIKRLKKRTYKNRYDKFKFNFYNKVQKGFIKIAKNKKNYMIIDSNRSVVENKNKILKKINQLVN